MCLASFSVNSTQQVKYVGNTDVFCFGFYSMSPKWTRTKIVIERTLLLQAYSCLPLAQAANRFLMKFSLQSALFSLCMAMRILFITFLFAYSAFKLLKCEVVNFRRSHLTHVNGRCLTIFQHVLIT